MAVEHVIRNGAGLTSTDSTVAVTAQRTTIISDEVSQWVKEGRVFMCIEGALTTPVTNAATDLVRQSPNIMIRVPATVVIVPLFVSWTPEATTAVAQMLVSCCNNDPGTTNVTQFTPVNANTRFALNTSKVTAWITPTTTTGTAPTGVADLYREYHQADRDAITGAPTPPLIYNPRMGHGQECAIGNNIAINAFLCYGVSGTTGTNTGFMIATWAEFTYDEYYATS